MQFLGALRVRQDNQEGGLLVDMVLIYMEGMLHDKEGNFFRQNVLHDEVAQSIDWICPKQIAQDLTAGFDYHVMRSALPQRCWLFYGVLPASETNNSLYAKQIGRPPDVNQWDTLKFQLGNEFYQIPIPSTDSDTGQILAIALAPILYKDTNIFVSGWGLLKFCDNKNNFNMPISAFVKMDEWTVFTDQRFLYLEGLSDMSVLTRKAMFLANRFYKENGRWPESLEEINKAYSNGEPISKIISVKTNVLNECIITNYGSFPRVPWNWKERRYLHAR